jgi:hypothetical protein
MSKVMGGTPRSGAHVSFLEEIEHTHSHLYLNHLTRTIPHFGEHDIAYQIIFLENMQNSLCSYPLVIINFVHLLSKYYINILLCNRKSTGA